MMTTKGIVNSETRAVDGPTGAAIVETESEGKPSMNSGAQVQSPASLIQPKGPTVIATFTGKE